MNHKKELLRSLWVEPRVPTCLRSSGRSVAAPEHSQGTVIGIPAPRILGV